MHGLYFLSRMSVISVVKVGSRPKKWAEISKVGRDLEGKTAGQSMFLKFRGQKPTFWSQLFIII